MQEKQAVSQEKTGGDPQPRSSQVDKKHGVDASFGDTRGTNTSAAPNMGSQITSGNDTGKTNVKGTPASNPTSDNPTGTSMDTGKHTPEGRPAVAVGEMPGSHTA